MIRKISGFHQDDLLDWVAELDCYHNQHVRHKPPFTNRPWVETAEHREERIGMELDCLRCERFEFPEDLEPYKRTPDFTETNIPAGLLKDHSTKAGTWGLIHVMEGQLRYTAGEHSEVLQTTKAGIVVPEMMHCVSPVGHVKFFVEFYRKM